MSKVRHRRKKSELPFADALAAANKRLSRALKEQEQARKSLASLNAEIPNLQRTIQALESQLGGLVPRPINPPTEQPVQYGIPVDVPLPAEDLAGMGSTRAVDEDVLPDAEGAEVIPEE